MEPTTHKHIDIDLSRTSCKTHGTHSRECPMHMERGLHARPCAMLMKLAAHFVRTGDGESVQFTVRDNTVNPANGILGMFGLVGGKGSVLTVTVRGADAQRAEGLLDAVEAVVRHPCPEDAVYTPDAARSLGLCSDVVAVLRHSVRNLKPE